MVLEKLRNGTYVAVAVGTSAIGVAQTFAATTVTPPDAATLDGISAMPMEAVTGSLTFLKAIAGLVIAGVIVKFGRSAINGAFSSMGLKIRI